MNNACAMNFFFHMTENLYRVYAMCHTLYVCMYGFLSVLKKFYTIEFACMTQYIWKHINPCVICILSWVCSLSFSFCRYKYRQILKYENVLAIDFWATAFFSFSSFLWMTVVEFQFFLHLLLLGVSMAGYNSCYISTLYLLRIFWHNNLSNGVQHRNGVSLCRVFLLWHSPT